MRSIKLVCTISIVLALVGCTTQRAIKETKRQYDNGEYGWALYTGTLGVTVAAIYDVFTLGGTSDVETGFNTVKSIANAHDKSSIQTVANNSTAAKAPSQVQQTAQSNTSQAHQTAQPNTSQAQQTAQSNTGQVQQTAQSNLQYSSPDTEECLQTGRTSDGQEFLKNKCNVTVQMGWCNAKTPLSTGVDLCRAAQTGFSPTGVTYVTQSGGLNPGDVVTQNIPAGQVQSSFVVMCKSGKGSPIIESFDSATITASSKYKGVCWNFKK